MDTDAHGDGELLLREPDKALLPIRCLANVRRRMFGGIGSAIARALADEGVRLFLVGRNLEKLTVAGEAFRADLTDDAQLRATAARVPGSSAGRV